MLSFLKDTMHHLESSRIVANTMYELKKSEERSIMNMYFLLIDKLRYEWGKPLKIKGIDEKTALFSVVLNFIKSQAHEETFFFKFEGERDYYKYGLYSGLINLLQKSYSEIVIKRIAGKSNWMQYSERVNRQLRFLRTIRFNKEIHDSQKIEFLTESLMFLLWSNYLSTNEITSMAQAKSEIEKYIFNETTFNFDAYSQKKTETAQILSTLIIPSIKLPSLYLGNFIKESYRYIN